MQTIVVGVDASATARQAATQAAELANSCGVPLHLVTAYAKRASQTVKDGSDTWMVDSLSSAEQLLADIASGLRVTCGVTSAVVQGDPAGAVIKEAKRIDASMIVVGNRRVRGVGRILGSVAADITRRAPCHVLIAKTT